MNKLKKYSGPSIISGDQNFAIPSHGNYGKFVLDKILENEDGVALVNCFFLMARILYFANIHCEFFEIGSLLHFGVGMV